MVWRKIGKERTPNKIDERTSVPFGSVMVSLSNHQDKLATGAYSSDEAKYIKVFRTERRSREERKDFMQVTPTSNLKRLLQTRIVERIALFNIAGFETFL